MKSKTSYSGVVIVLALFCVWNIAVYAEESEANSLEWHQWRGPNRDGISLETGLLKRWSDDGPTELWRISLGEGFSGVSISNGRAYTMFVKGEDEIVVCLDAASGKEIWRYLDDYRFENRQGGDGPRATPTVDGNRVYVLSAYGRLVALDALNGKELWSHDFTKAFSSNMPRHGFSTSPIIEGDLLLIETGGESGKALVACDKRSGKIVWSSEDDASGYSSPITVTVLGKRQTVFFTGRGLVSVSPKDGEIYWRYDWPTRFNVNAATPIFISPDKIFISSGYDMGAAVVQIQETGDGLSAAEVWTSREMKNHFSSSVLHDGYLYGFDNAFLKCIDAETGEEQWVKRGFGKGSLLFADGNLIILGEEGSLVLAKATPTQYEEAAQTQIFHGRCWTMPTLSDGKLYLRNTEELICLDWSERG
ncbi:MAG: PQQ-like beta-propeller repeat protein [Candidatus Poribacteria bacterium]|nr:PQQ-like beta-propeller repeat protein [Candidatus Poribacteria bacterium]MDE0505501.1 PQQ-like beta-propeller repeat protein [Candidatus Poribacteria bacterium]